MRFRAVHGSSGRDQRLARLVRTVDTEIIPRLVLARRVGPERICVPASDGWAPGGEDIVHLAGVAVTQSFSVLLTHLKAMHARGTPVETLYLDLLAPTARHLGELWVQDLCDFTQVTTGLGRLQRALHELGPAFESEAEHRQIGHRAMLMPMPGDQHTFGLSMVVEFFRRAGWEVWDELPAAAADVVSAVRKEWFAVAGLSVSCESRLDTLAAVIRAIRRASRNRAIGVMVGGPVFIEHPDFVALVGADATAVDGSQAVLQAQRIQALLPGEP